jgi:hypothetical protein
MDASSGQAGGKSLLDLIVGIEVGVIGALVTLGWFALLSPIIGDPWWIIPNLFASNYYTEYQVRSGPGIVTLVGSALHLFMSGVVGAINGLLTPGGRLFGLGIALMWYGLCYFLLWKRWTPLVPVYGSHPLLMTGWFLFGSILGSHPWFAAQARLMEQPKIPVS